MKGDVLNSPKERKIFSHYTEFILGYANYEIKWGHGHFTVVKNFHFTFWSYQIKYAIIRFLNENKTKTEI